MSKCQYCKESLFEYESYSIPLNKNCTRWYGTYCSRQCRLTANRYVCDPPTITPSDYTEREQYIRRLDMTETNTYYNYAPNPTQLLTLKRSTWMPESNMKLKEKIKK